VFLCGIVKVQQRWNRNIAALVNKHIAPRLALRADQVIDGGQPLDIVEQPLHRGAAGLRDVVVQIAALEVDVGCITDPSVKVFRHDLWAMLCRSPNDVGPSHSFLQVALGTLAPCN